MQVKISLEEQHCSKIQNRTYHSLTILPTFKLLIEKSALIPLMWQLINCGVTHALSLADESL